MRTTNELPIIELPANAFTWTGDKLVAKDSQLRAIAGGPYVGHLWKDSSGVGIAIRGALGGVRRYDWLRNEYRDGTLAWVFKHHVTRLEVFIYDDRPRGDLDAVPYGC